MENKYTQEEAEGVLRCIANAVESFFPKMGFALILFEFNKPGIGNYISNGKRKDMVKALRETADRLESKQKVTKGE